MSMKTTSSGRKQKKQKVVKITATELLNKTNEGLIKACDILNSEGKSHILEAFDIIKKLDIFTEKSNISIINDNNLYACNIQQRYIKVLLDQFLNEIILDINYEDHQIKRDHNLVSIMKGIIDNVNK